MLFLKHFIVATAIAVAPVLAIAQSEVYEGGWEDGTTIHWQCAKNAEGKLRFMIKLPDGKIYQGILSCGTSV